MMKMCAAMARAKHDVVLFGRRSQGQADADIFRYYGTEPTFELDLVSTSFGLGVPALAGATRLMKRAITFKPDLYYARRRPHAVVASFGSSPLIFEAHEMPGRAHHRQMEARIFRAKTFRRLVTISKALADDYLIVWPDLSSKIIVAYSASDRASEIDIALCDRKATRRSAGRICGIFISRQRYGDDRQTCPTTGRDRLSRCRRRGSTYRILADHGLPGEYYVSWSRSTRGLVPLFMRV